MYNGRIIALPILWGGTKLKIDQKKSNSTKWNKETGRLEKLVVVIVRCNKCYTRGPTTSMYASYYDRPTKLLEEKAIEAWNTRTPKERGGKEALYECYKNELDQWKERQALTPACPNCGAKMDVERK